MAIRDEFEGFVLGAAYDAWKTHTPDDDPYGQAHMLRHSEEEIRERLANDIVTDILGYVEREGWPAFFKRVAEAIAAQKPQRDLFRG